MGNANFEKRYSSYRNKSKQDMYAMRYFQYFYNLALTRFEWNGLPDEILPRYIEELLFWNGDAVFFHEEVIEKYGVMAVSLGGTLDTYSMPNRRFAYSHGYHAELDKTNSVLLRDSMSNYPLAEHIMMYSDSLANMRLTRDINIFAQRTPLTFAGTSDMQLSAKNLFKQYTDFVPFISVKDNVMDLDKLKVLNTGAPLVFNEITIAMRQEMVEALTLLGIDASDTTKKERMITDEVKGNTGEMEMNRNSALAVRLRACEQINKLFGLNLSVKFRSELKIVDEPELPEVPEDFMNPPEEQEETEV